AGRKQFNSAELQCAFDLPDIALPAGTPVGLSLRPQHLKFSGADNAKLRTTVLRHVYAGQSTRLWLQAGSRTLIVDWHAGDDQALPAQGAAVGLTWDSSRASVVPL